MILSGITSPKMFTFSKLLLKRKWVLGISLFYSVQACLVAEKCGRKFVNLLSRLRVWELEVLVKEIKLSMMNSCKLGCFVSRENVGK